MTVWIRQSGLIFSLAITLALGLVAPVFAQTHQNFVHRHPTMTAVAAGAGTTMLLKHSAKNKREHGEHLNFAERHPYLSGAGVAVVTHHELKKHRQN